MPYFQRKPFADLISATSAGAEPGAALDILELAAGVLAQETGNGPARFRLRETLTPGGIGTMVLSLAQDEGAQPITIRLSPGDLVGPSGRIPASQVTLDPDCVVFGSGGERDVRVTVAAPPGTAPGIYAGTLTSADDAGLLIPFDVPVGS
jgi:hypothetical protein